MLATPATDAGYYRGSLYEPEEHPDTLWKPVHWPALADAAPDCRRLRLHRTQGQFPQGQRNTRIAQAMALYARPRGIRAGLAAPARSRAEPCTGHRTPTTGLAAPARQTHAPGALRPDDRCAPGRLADPQCRRQAHTLLRPGAAGPDRPEQGSGWPGQGAARAGWYRRILADRPACARRALSPLCSAR